MNYFKFTKLKSFWEQIKAKLFDYSTHLSDFNNLHEKQKKKPLVIKISRRGMISKLYGEIWPLACRHLGAGEQFKVDSLGGYDDYYFEAYHYNYFYDPKHVNEFIDNNLVGAIGDVLITKFKVERFKPREQQSLNEVDMNWLLENNIISSELRGHFSLE